MREAFSLLSGWAVSAAVGALFLGVVGAANASVLIEQAPLADGEAIFSNIDGGAQNADSFFFGGNVTVDNIKWWGSYAVDDGDQFVVRIFDDNSGSPGTLLLAYNPAIPVRATTSLKDSGGADVYEYSFDGVPTDFQAGTYYLSIMNDGPNYATGWNWLTSSANPDENFYRGLDADSWTVDKSGNLSMQINGVRQQSVPEPGTIALMLLVGGMLTFSRRLANRRRA